MGSETSSYNLISNVCWYRWIVYKKFKEEMKGVKGNILEDWQEEWDKQELPDAEILENKFWIVRRIWWSKWKYN